jgi:hypothetical protein
MCVPARHGLQGECGLGSALGLLHRPRELGPEPVHPALHRPLPGGRVESVEALLSVPNPLRTHNPTAR